MKPLRDSPPRSLILHLKQEKTKRTQRTYRYAPCTYIVRVATETEGTAHEEKTHNGTNQNKSSHKEKTGKEKNDQMHDSA